MNLVKLKHKIKIKKKLKINSKNLFLKIILTVFCYIFLAYSNVLQQGIKNGIDLCANTLIPSLFPFMMLASFIVTSDIFEKPNPILSKITEKLFYLPGYTYPTIIMSFIGGYPVGAKMVKTLYEKSKINDEQLNRMMCFCTNSGPAFTISLLGETILKNKAIGLIIFLVQITAGITVGIVCGIKAKYSGKIFYISKNNNCSKKINIQESLVESVYSTCESLMQMCAIIVLFTTIIHLLNSLNIFELIASNLLKVSNINPNLKMISISALEITYGCAYTASHFIPCSVTAFAIGYGGFCTHLQITSILKKTEFKYTKFFLFRLINALFSATIIYLISYLWPETLPTISTLGNDSPIIKSSSTPIGSIALIILCIYFIISIKIQKK